MIKAIQPYIDNEEFQPAAIAKVSKACTSICQWVRAMHKYHFVAKVVEPKRVRNCDPAAFGVQEHSTGSSLLQELLGNTTFYRSGCNAFVIQGLDWLRY